MTDTTLTRNPVLSLLIHYKGPTGLKRVGRIIGFDWLSKRNDRNPAPLEEGIDAALARQTVTASGTEAAYSVLAVMT